jgi:hypothetical protein
MLGTILLVIHNDGLWMSLLDMLWLVESSQVAVLHKNLCFAAFIAVMV